MIFISAGHNQNRKGAAFQNITEFDEALLWQKEISALIGEENAIAVPSSGLTKKIKFINEKIEGLPLESHIAIEIHFNSDPSSKGKGSETLYYPTSYYGNVLAISIQEKLGIIFEPNRGAKEGWYQMDKSKGPDYFLEKTKCPALIIEPEFIHNYAKIVEARTAGCTVIADTLKNLNNK